MSDIDQILNKIWFTYKSRMRAEERLRLSEARFYFLNCYYSSILIIFAVFDSEISAHVPFFDKIMISMTVIVFVSSLFVYGLQNSKTADKHRECYLKLQALYNSGKSSSATANEIAKKYEDIIENYPNHSEKDYDYFTNYQIVIRKNSLSYPQTGNNINIDCFTAVRFRVKILFEYLLTPIFCFAPIVILIILANLK